MVAKISSGSIKLGYSIDSERMSLSFLLCNIFSPNQNKILKTDD